MEKTMTVERFLNSRVKDEDRATFISLMELRDGHKNILQAEYPVHVLCETRNHAEMLQGI